MSQDSKVAALHSSCTIRQAQLCDCNAMAELALQLGYECSGEEVRDRLTHMQDLHHQYAVFVAELPGGQVAGWVGAYLFRSVETESCAEISGLVVDQNLRSRGIGKILLEAAERWAVEIGCQTISVRSNVKRDRAHRFYSNNRYQHVKTQKEFRKIL
jgi:GNAT superfamily N-acetyltransferase